jgi:hypothetical protein
MPRPQFTLKTMLWLTALVAAFFAGAIWEHQRENARWTVEVGGSRIDLRGYFYPEGPPRD